MAGLIDLLPDDMSEEEKQEHARRLAETRNRTCKIPTKEELARKMEIINERYRSFDEWASIFEHKSKVLRRAAGEKIKKTPFKKRRISNKKEFATVNKKLLKLKKTEENKKRELAKSGIIIYDHVFTRLDDGYSVGRKKSLEWNDETARRGFGSKGREEKRRRKKKKMI